MNVSLRQLKAFLGVADCGNFTRAAQLLHVSQAALSATVAELESQLGSRLFARTTRNVRLTAAGEELVPTARRVVLELEAASQRLRQAGRKQAARITLGFTPLMAAHVVPEVLERFMAEMPDVAVKLVDTSPSDIAAQVVSGEIDAGFGAFFSHTAGLRQQPLLQWRLLVASSEEQRGLTVPFVVQGLAGHRLIAVNVGSPVQRLVDSELKRAGVEPSDRWEVNQLETAIAMVERGFGLAVIPSFAASSCRHYRVRLRPLAGSGQYEFARISRAGHELPESVDTFGRIFADVVETAMATLVGERTDDAASGSPDDLGAAPGGTGAPDALPRSRTIPA